MLLSTVVILTACDASDPADDNHRADDVSPPRSEQKYRGTGMVLEEKGADPGLCLGVVLTSLPPQCDGIPIAGWDWDEVSGEESASGTIWGDFEVTGLYDGEVFTLIKAGPARRQDTEDEEIKSPCPQPVGGWERPDPALSSEQDYRNATRAARREPDFSGAWIDYIDRPTESTDPQDIILNLAFTGELVRHEKEIRESWGGPLCVVKYGQTFERLSRIQSELHEVAEQLDLEILYTDASEYRNVVEVGVVVIDAARQKEIDERYGKGVVEITAELQPVR